MSNLIRLMVPGILLLLVGCEVAPPASDTTPPEITVMVSRGRGDNIFRSTEGELGTGDDCIKIGETPTQLILIVGDAGGVERGFISAFPGTIVPESVEVTPAAPEASSSISSERSTDTLEITLTPPGPDTVRTGATAILDVAGDLPIAISAGARDHSGNTASLPQFDLRSLDDPVVCRGG